MADLREAAAQLLHALEMEQHNADIFKGEWKKGSKAWSGDFVEKMKAEGVASVRAALADTRAEALSKMSELVPTTWLDPLLTGPNAALPAHLNQCNGIHIEALLRGIRKRIEGAEASEGRSPDATIEECAKVCEQLMPSRSAERLQLQRDTLENAAMLIRNLKGRVSPLGTPVCADYQPRLNSDLCLYCGKTRTAHVKEG